MIKLTHGTALVILGIVVGFILNIYANKISENNLKKYIAEQIAQIKAKQATGRISPEESAQLAKQEIELNAQLQLLQNK